MKLIQNTDFTGKLKDTYGNVSNLLSQVLGGDAKGMTVSEMRERVKIIDKLDSYKSDSVIELEDAEHAKVKAVYSATQWGIADKQFVAVLDDLENPKTK